MAAVDYHGLLIRLKSLLEADSTLSGVPIFVEEEPTFDVLGSGRAVLLVLDSRRAPPGEQPMAAGSRTRWEIRIGIFAIGFDMKFEEAAKKRDDLLGLLDIALMNSTVRTIDGKLSHSYMEGGAFIPVMQQQNGMYALGECVLVGEATSIR